MKYPHTELVLNDKGHVYHLGLSPEHVSDKIILVGDQDRVNLVASFFDSVEHSSQHREFVCKTGVYQGKRISAISTGIGTDNIAIVPWVRMHTTSGTEAVAALLSSTVIGHRRFGGEGLVACRQLEAGSTMRVQLVLYWQRIHE